MQTFRALQATVEDVKQALHRAKPKLYPSRQRLTLPAEEGQKPLALESGKKLSDYAIDSSTTVTFKDLGAQVSCLEKEPGHLCRKGAVVAQLL